MILYNKKGDFCICEEEQIDNIKSIGYEFTINPIQDTVAPKDEAPKTPEIKVEVEKPKRKKDIIL